GSLYLDHESQFPWPHGACRQPRVSSQSICGCRQCHRWRDYRSAPSPIDAESFWGAAIRASDAYMEKRTLWFREVHRRGLSLAISPRDGSCMSLLQPWWWRLGGDVIDIIASGGRADRIFG